MLLKIDPSLTGKDEPDRKRALATHAGMAHFAGTGPVGTWCCDCLFWEKIKATVQEQARCQKYRALMRGSSGPKVPGRVTSCKYFMARPLDLLKAEASR